MADQTAPRGILTRITDSSAPEAELVDKRSLTIVVVNFPVAASQAGVPAFRPAPPIARRAAYWRSLLAPPALRPRRLGSAIQLLWLAPAAVAGIWLARAPVDPDSATGAVRIQLPAPTPWPAAQPEHIGADHQVAVGTAASSLALGRGKPVARASASRPPVANGRVGASAALAAIDDLPEVRAATGLALRDGVAQSWRAKGLEGIAVAGPIQLQGSNLCRTVAILADGGGGGGGQTMNSLRCMTRGGQWVRLPDQSGSAPQLPQDPSKHDPAGRTGARDSADAPEDKVAL